MPITKPEILIVDDIKDNQIVLKLVLDHLDATIHTASSGSEALDLVKKHSISLVLLDVQMPEMDGFSVAKALQDNPDSSHIPIILISACLNTDQDKIKGLNNGAIDYLDKPIKDDLLLAKISRVLKLQQVQKQQAKEDVDKLKNSIIQNFNHEMRTPIHGASNLSEILFTEWIHLDEGEKYAICEKIYHSCKRMMDYSDNIIDLKDMHLQNITFNLGHHDIPTVIEQVITELTPNIDEGLSIHFSPPAFNTVIECDIIGIEQVIENLLDNAIKFTLSGSIQIHMSPSSLTWNDKQIEALAIHITDTGIGIPDDELEDIFESFSESSLTQCLSGGKGLGLSICHEIITAHNGTILAKNNENGIGTTFSITLPKSVPEQN